MGAALLLVFALEPLFVVMELDPVGLDVAEEIALLVVVGLLLRPKIPATVAAFEPLPLAHGDTDPPIPFEPVPVLILPMDLMAQDLL
jgi:hypothetical protein